MSLPQPTELESSRIGFLSDSHGDVFTTRRAVAALVDAGAGALIHLGDVCDDAVFDELITTGASGEGFLPVWSMVGNMDAYPSELREAARPLGITVDDPVGCYRSAGRLIVTQHGHHRGVETLARDAGADYYLQGHTHKVRDAVVDGLRLLNPGALHRAERLTAALLDVDSGVFSVLDISRAELG